ncbi:MAG TPA: Ig-like domain repeat protein [Phycisphaerae bacterium]|nr:Ig-like domain repeat protein [Phycisphaerae bacterium]
MKRKRVCPQFEILESRLLLSSMELAPTYEKLTTPGLSPLQTSGPQGFTPAEIRTAYGLNQVTFGSVSGDGSGQTIAIIDAYNDPTIAADLRAFDAAFNLPNPTLTVVGQDGSTHLPGVDPAGQGNDNWEGEEALDVEWAHAMAPGASILLVEASDASPSNLFAAVNMARNRAGVSVITMSFGGNETSNETTFDSDFTTPSGHTGVAFVASTGDSGRPGGYPAYSPNVVAVGGTSLSTNSVGTYQSESAWSGSGGGISTVESQPSYQKGVVTQSTTRRTIPDVAFDADPSTGVAVYDSYNNGTSTPWEVLGGTSVAAPAWAGLFAVADQGRVLAGEGTLDSRTNTLPLLYSAPAADFHDITSGSNGFSASSGYDLVTGRGSPQANLLIPYLVSGNTTVTNPTGPVSIASLSADATTVTQGTPVTITANGVVDNGSGVVVTFYEESNGVAGLQTGTNGDFAFTPVTDGSNAFVFDTSTPGVYTIYAQVTDSSGAASATGASAPFITITVNAPTATTGPSIASISATPSPVVSGDTLTLTANGLSDPSANIRRVYFYQETNGIPGLQTGPDGDFSFRGVGAFSNYSIALDTTGVTGSVTFYAMAVDVAGNTSATGTSAPTVTVNITSDVRPDAPTNLRALPASPTSINLSFSQTDSGQTGFIIERATDPNFLNFVQLFTINRPNLTTYSDTGLSPNTRYYYRVEAFNDAGDSTFSNTANAVTPLPATKLVITQQPSSTIAGSAFAKPIVIQLQNANGQLVTTDNSAVTIAILSGPAGGTITGTISVNAVNGIARFTTLTFNKTGTYALRATDAKLTAATTSSFTVSPDIASARVVITQMPTPGLAGNTLKPLVAELVDQFNNLITNSSVLITIITPGHTGILKGSLSQTPHNGFVTFNDLTFSAGGPINVVVAANALPNHPRASYTQTILLGSTQIPVPHLSNPYTFGQTITLTTQLHSNTTVPFTGTATIQDQNGTVVATLPVSPNGTIQFTRKGVALGTHLWTIVYPGDTTHAAATSAQFVILVNSAPAATKRK